jgi:hypothetical protein
MGMRQTANLHYSDGGTVAVYAHWDGDDDINASPLAEKIRTALKRRERWDDEGYLARIIISAILKEDIDGATGYGIYANSDGGAGEYPSIEVNLAEGTVNGITYEKFIALYD